MRVFIASDHAGVEMKAAIQKALSEHHWTDLGTTGTASVDYPDFAANLCGELLKSTKSGVPTLGILICGTGIGMSIAANKIKGIRAAHAESIESAKLAREHNDSQILCLGARITPLELAAAMAKVFLETAFSGGERHQARIAKIQRLSSD